MYWWASSTPGVDTCNNVKLLNHLTLVKLADTVGDSLHCWLCRTYAVSLSADNTDDQLYDKPCDIQQA